MRWAKCGLPSASLPLFSHEGHRGELTAEGEERGFPGGHLETVRAEPHGVGTATSKDACHQMEVSIQVPPVMAVWGQREFQEVQMVKIGKTQMLRRQGERGQGNLRSKG